MGGDQTESQHICAHVLNGLDSDIVTELREMFHKCHKYIGILPMHMNL